VGMFMCVGDSRIDNRLRQNLAKKKAARQVQTGLNVGRLCMWHSKYDVMSGPPCHSNSHHCYSRVPKRPTVMGITCILGYFRVCCV
jgi:hypothetical protein